MPCPRALLADDAPEMLEKVTLLLKNDYEIVGAAQDGEGVLKSVARLDPDLVILDISMPLLNGIQVASSLRQQGCRARVIFVTVHDDRDYVEGAFAVGAMGYVLKSRIASDLIPAVQHVLRGEMFTSPIERVES